MGHNSNSTSSNQATNFAFDDPNTLAIELNLLIKQSNVPHENQSKCNPKSPSNFQLAKNKTNAPNPHPKLRTFDGLTLPVLKPRHTKGNLPFLTNHETKDKKEFLETSREKTHIRFFRRILTNTTRASKGLRLLFSPL